MGLDILVYRVIPQKENSDETFLLAESPELEVFSHLAFEKEDDYYDIEGELKKLGHNPEDLQWRGSEYGEEVKFSFVTSDGKEFDLIDPPTIKKTERFLQVEEVGYQRKGANKKFYAEGMWDSPCVLKMETLKDHWEKYFSHQTPESEGGWGSGVEYTLDDEEMKSRFKENIIDKFVEGETFVCYC
jgi:hypothetical protein